MRFIDQQKQDLLSMQAVIRILVCNVRLLKCDDLHSKFKRKSRGKSHLSRMFVTYISFVTHSLYWENELTVDILTA